MEKLSKTPWLLTRDDLKALRDVGLDDDAIREVAHVGAMFAALTRLADAMDFDLPPTEGSRKRMAFVLWMGGYDTAAL